MGDEQGVYENPSRTIHRGQIHRAYSIAAQFIAGKIHRGENPSRQNPSRTIHRRIYSLNISLFMHRSLEG